MGEMENDRIAELEAEINRLRAEIERLKERERDLEDSRRVMLYMLEDLNEATASIERAKREWEATFDAIKDPIFIHDKEFKVVRANRAYIQSTGVSFEEVIGKPYYEIFPKMDGPFKMCLKPLELQKEEEVVSFPSIDRIFKMRFYPIKDVEERYLYSVHILEDITEAKRAEERIKEEVEINRALLDVVEVTGTVLDRDEILRRVVEIVPKVAGADRCTIFLWDKGKDTFLPVQVWGMPQELMPDFWRLRFTPGIPMVDKIIKGEVVVIEDAMGSPLIPEEITRVFGMRSILYHPVVIRGKVMAVIGVDRVDIPRPFRKREEQLLHGISNQVAITMDSAMLYREMVDKSIELSRMVETITTMHDIDRTILSTLETQEIMETATQMVSRVIPSDRVTVALVDKERGGFVYKAGFGVRLSKGTFIPFEDTSATEVVRTGRSQFTPDLSMERNLLPLERMFLDDGYHSHIRVPLVVKGGVIGLLNVGSKRVANFTPDHLATMEKLVNQIAIALENARLVEDLKELFLGTVRAFSVAIDAKSPWTAGHSERVTKYAVDIGREMGLDGDTLKVLEVAGLLHDIGKIGTYEAILDKADTLTDEEFELVRGHPRKGAEILTPIRQLKDIVPAVRHHHERYEGKGYPDGLKGEEIPLMARILAVADTVDAMSAERPYRKGKSIDEIIEELKRCSGSQFDPEVVEAFLKTLPSS